MGKFLPCFQALTVRYEKGVTPEEIAFLVTDRLRSCVAVCIHNVDFKRISFTHVDRLFPFKFLEQELAWVKQVGPVIIKIYRNRTCLAKHQEMSAGLAKDISDTFANVVDGSKPGGANYCVIKTKNAERFFKAEASFLAVYGRDNKNIIKMFANKPAFYLACLFPGRDSAVTQKPLFDSAELFNGHFDLMTVQDGLSVYTRIENDRYILFNAAEYQMLTTLLFSAPVLRQIFTMVRHKQPIPIPLCTQLIMSADGIIEVPENMKNQFITLADRALNSAHRAS